MMMMMMMMSDAAADAADADLCDPTVISKICDGWSTTNWFEARNRLEPTQEWKILQNIGIQQLVISGGSKYSCKEAHFGEPWRFYSS